MPKILIPLRLAIPLLAATFLLGGCNVLLVAKTLMDTQLDSAGAACVAKADTLLVLLPGPYPNIDEFVGKGKVSAVRERCVAADVMLVDALMGDSNNGTILEQLEADVFGPARAAGYRSVWLVGVSIGGLGTVLHDEALPASITDMVLIAPYLGEREALASIEAADGLRAWKAPAGPLPKDPMEPRIWR